MSVLNTHIDYTGRRSSEFNATMKQAETKQKQITHKKETHFNKEEIGDAERIQLYY